MGEYKMLPDFSVKSMFFRGLRYLLLFYLLCGVLLGLLLLGLHLLPQ
jgi:hypothetical protein